MRKESRRAVPSLSVIAVNVADRVPTTENVTVNPGTGTLSGRVTTRTAGGSFDNVPATPKIVVGLAARTIARLKSGTGGPEVSWLEPHP
jgi:hypothetical protein